MASTNTINLSDQAYQFIKTKIMNLDYAPGEKISTTSISEASSLGKTPVREALLRLSQEQLVNMVPQSGAYVAKINLKIAQESRFTRELIETEIMQQAAATIQATDIDWLNQNLKAQTTALQQKNLSRFFELDNAFHRYFYVMTNHELSWNWLELININLDRFRRLRIENNHLKWQLLIDQHQTLLTAVINHDLTDVRFHELMHIRLMLTEEGSVQQAFPTYFV